MAAMGPRLMARQKGLPPPPAERSAEPDGVSVARAVLASAIAAKGEAAALVDRLQDAMAGRGLERWSAANAAVEAGEAEMAAARASVSEAFAAGSPASASARLSAARAQLASAREEHALIDAARSDLRKQLPAAELAARTSGYVVKEAAEQVVLEALKAQTPELLAEFGQVFERYWLLASALSWVGDRTRADLPRGTMPTDILRYREPINLAIEALTRDAGAAAPDLTRQA